MFARPAADPPVVFQPSASLFGPRLCAAPAALEPDDARRCQLIAAWVARELAQAAPETPDGPPTLEFYVSQLDAVAAAKRELNRFLFDLDVQKPCNRRVLHIGQILLASARTPNEKREQQFVASGPFDTSITSVFMRELVRATQHEAATLTAALARLTKARDGEEF